MSVIFDLYGCIVPQTVENSVDMWIKDKLETHVLYKITYSSAFLK